AAPSRVVATGCESLPRGGSASSGLRSRGPGVRLPPGAPPQRRENPGGGQPLPTQETAPLSTAGRSSEVTRTIVAVMAGKVPSHWSVTLAMQSLSEIVCKEWLGGQRVTIWRARFQHW